MTNRDPRTWSPSAPPGPQTPSDEKSGEARSESDYNRSRIDTLQLDIRETIMQAVKEAMPTALLNAEEYRWVQLAIKREAQIIAFRQRVIDKTLTGLVWSLIIGLGVMVKEYLAAHGWRP